MSGKSGLSLDLLHMGHCLAPMALTAQGAPWRLGRFPAGAALIRHPRHGTILFDTGYGQSFFDATTSLPERFYRWLTPVRLPKAQRLTQQLQRHGVTAPDMVILSHLHADHVAGLFDLAQPPAAIITSAQAKAGLDTGRIASLKAGCPLLLRDALRRQTMTVIEDHPLITLQPHELGTFRTGHDLLGDGSMVAVPLPGHGQGQFGLYLPDLDHGPAFLIADAAWSLAALRDNRPPPRNTLNRLGNAARYLDTFSALCTLHRLRPELRLIASHCPETFPEQG